MKYKLIKDSVEEYVNRINSGDMDVFDLARLDEFKSMSDEDVRKIANGVESEDQSKVIWKMLYNRSGVRDSLMTSANFGPYVPGKVKDGDPFVAYLTEGNVKTKPGVIVEMDDDLSKIVVNRNGENYDYYYDVMTGLVTDENGNTYNTDEFLDMIESEWYAVNDSRIQDADKVRLTGEKTYSMYQLQENPPSWVEDLILWDKILEKVTENGTKEVRAVIPLAIYKRKLAKKQKEAVEDSFDTHDYTKYIVESGLKGYPNSFITKLHEEGKVEFKDLEGNTVKADNRQHAVDVLADQICDYIYNKVEIPQEVWSPADVEAYSERMAETLLPVF